LIHAAQLTRPFSFNHMGIKSRSYYKWVALIVPAVTNFANSQARLRTNTLAIGGGYAGFELNW
jgi:hypothetical protein